MEDTRIRITSGEIATRLVAAIYKTQTIHGIFELRSNGVLMQTGNDFVDYRNLCYECIDEILRVTSTSAAYIIFGTQTAAIQDYTEYDDDVIQVLNAASPATLENIEALIYSYYPTIAWTDKVVSQNPADRFYAYLDSRKKSYTNREPKEVYLREGYASEIAISELTRFKTLGIRGKFKTDPLPDIARGIGISVHWLMGLKSPLFCNNETAEHIFDLFTLMPRSRQSLIAKILQYAKESQSNG